MAESRPIFFNDRMQYEIKKARVEITMLDEALRIRSGTEATRIHNKDSRASQGRKGSHSRSGWTPWQRLYDDMSVATADANIFSPDRG